MKGAVLIPMTLILVAGVTTAIAFEYPYLQAKIVPMLVGGAILLLSVVELVKELRGSKKSAPAINLVAEDEEEKKEGISTRSFFVEGSWMIGFFFAIYLIGFIGGIGVFTTLYIGMHKARWWIAALIGFLMAVLSYVLFSYTTDTELYPGIIARYLGLAG